MSNFDPAQIPTAWCWQCRTDVVVWQDYAEDDPAKVTRCLTCDARIDRWRTDVEIRHRDVTDLEPLGFAILGEASGHGCGSGSCGAGEGGCTGCGGGGGCWKPAADGRAADLAATGVKSCGSCAIKRSCAEKKRAVMYAEAPQPGA
jgi:hypothetical protein